MRRPFQARTKSSSSSRRSRHTRKATRFARSCFRSLKKAAYRASADGHYGLAKKDYTHFTSPIRRYSDLVVHRVFDTYLVKHAGHPPLAGAKPALTLGQMESIGEHLSVTEINSAEAERESVKIKLLEFFERELAKRKRPASTPSSPTSAATVSSSNSSNR
ncbi:MAG: RNB domain-containing ribonuclease [Nibricoccus sp.]